MHISPFILLLVLNFISSCGSDKDVDETQIDENQSDYGKSQDDDNLRFVSNDRKRRIYLQIMKNLLCYPAIMLQKRGRWLIYRDSIETPFTGRIDRFANGEVKMDSLILKGNLMGYR